VWSNVVLAVTSFAGSTPVGVVAGAAGGAVFGDATFAAGDEGTGGCSDGSAWAACAGTAGGMGAALASGICTEVGVDDTAGVDGAGGAD